MKSHLVGAVGEINFKCLTRNSNGKGHLVQEVSELGVE